MTDITHIYPGFLLCPTPIAWVEEAAKPENLPILLVDHANLEHNAAQSALTTIRRYRHGMPGIAKSGLVQAVHGDLLHMLSRLAREELRHFEQVLKMVSGLSDLNMEVCCTLGMVNKNQAERLAEAGLHYYNHNIDTSEEYCKIARERCSQRIPQTKR